MPASPSSSRAVPAIIVPTSLALVHFHPEPVDDCPCFEDAIAVLSCSMGSFVGHWQVVSGGIDHLYTTEASIFDYGLLYGAVTAVYRVVLGAGCCSRPVSALTAGLGIMVGFRFIAKSALLKVLPPLFRQVDSLYDLGLTTRRFYTAATSVDLARLELTLTRSDYHDIPQPNILSVPSVLDLHAAKYSPLSSFDNTAETSGTSSADHSPRLSATPSPTLGASTAARNLSLSGLQEGGLRKRGDKRKHEPYRSDSGKSIDDAYGGEQYVWVSKRKRKSRAERARYDAEGGSAVEPSVDPRADGQY